jgi:aryl-alcohol dehydrogenase-like predicted oxidoreductase
VQYLEENVAALEIMLNADDVATIEAAVPSEAVQGERYADMGSIDR